MTKQGFTVPDIIYRYYIQVHVYMTLHSLHEVVCQVVLRRGGLRFSLGFDKFKVNKIKVPFHRNC